MSTENNIPKEDQIVPEELKSEIQEAAPVTPPKEEVKQISIDQFFETDLRVAEIKEVIELPKSNKLIKLKLWLGTDLGERQILAGIAKHYTSEELVGRKIVVVANLKPAKLMGELSEGMLLAVDSGEDVILINPGQDTPVGTQVG